MQPRYWRARWRKSGWTRHLSGPISPDSHAICCIDESISSWVASLVSRTPSPEAAAECPTSATSGPTSGASRDRSEPPHSSSRTSAASFGAASLSCWKMLPPRGGMRNGRAFERRMSALRTGASACSSSHGAQGQLYPTPSATPYGTSQNEGACRTTGRAGARRASRRGRRDGARRPLRTGKARARGSGRRGRMETRGRASRIRSRAGRRRRRRMPRVRARGTRRARAHTRECRSRTW